MSDIGFGFEGFLLEKGYRFCSSSQMSTQMDVICDHIDIKAMYFF